MQDIFYVPLERPCVPCANLLLLIIVLQYRQLYLERHCKDSLTGRRDFIAGYFYVSCPSKRDSYDTWDFLTGHVLASRCPVLSNRNIF